MNSLTFSTPNLYLSFGEGVSVEVVSYTDTMYTYSVISLESAGENAPKNTVVYLDDSVALKEFKALLKRKKAVIAFGVCDGNVVCSYQYDTLVKVEGQKKRKRTECSGTLILGKAIAFHELETNHSRFFNRTILAVQDYSTLAYGQDVLPSLVSAMETPHTKLEFDVVLINDVLFNKKDLEKMLRVFKGVSSLHVEVSATLNVACFTAPDSDTEVYMKTVKEYKNESFRV